MLGGCSLQAYRRVEGGARTRSFAGANFGRPSSSTTSSDVEASASTAMGSRGSAAEVSRRIGSSLEASGTATSAAGGASCSRFSAVGAGMAVMCLRPSIVLVFEQNYWLLLVCRENRECKWCCGGSGFYALGNLAVGKSAPQYRAKFLDDFVRWALGERAIFQWGRPAASGRPGLPRV